ncbi:hypothetical protein JCM10213_007670 [Rhodosporidiobolus nylandii]
MLLRGLLAFSLLAGAALAGTKTSLASLKKELAAAQSQEAKAVRLVKRAKTYKTASAQHKIAVFTKRQQKWAKEASELEKSIRKLSHKAAATATRTAKPTWSASKKPSSSHPSSTSRMVTSSRPSATKTATKTPTPTSKKGKKMLGYNDAQLLRNFGLVSAYSWASEPDGALNKGVEFVPMLWSGNSPGDWATVARQQIAAGAEYLLGFNEPDMSLDVGGSDMTVAESVAAWKKYMSPLASKAKLISPAVSNGGSPSGLTYLAEFFENCPQCYNETEAIALHWYDSATNIDYFKNYFIDAYKQFKKPIWITEFAGSGTVEEQTKFFKTVVGWMDDQPWIQRYGAFAGTFVEADGSLTDLGKAYNNA